MSEAWRALQDAYRDDIAKLDADRMLAQEQAMAEIAANYKLLRQARFAEYIAARDVLLARERAPKAKK